MQYIGNYPISNPNLNPPTANRNPNHITTSANK